MFVEQIKLKKNSWATKLMKWIWGLEPENFSHICPFFWLSLFNILIFIPFSILKVVSRSFFFMICKLVDFFEKKSEIKQEKNEKKAEILWQSILTDNAIRLKYLQLYAKWGYRSYNRKCLSEIEQELLRKIYVDEQIYLDEIKKYREEFKEKKNTEAEKIIQNKKKINKVLKVIKPIIQILLILITLFGLYYASKLIIYLTGSYTVDIQFFKRLFNTLLAIILVILGAIIISFTIAYIVAKNKNSFCKVKQIFKPIGRGIGKIFMIIGQMIKNNCPAIKWEK